MKTTRKKNYATPITDTVTYVMGKCKMYKIPASEFWYYEFWINKCSTYPKGKRERKSTFQKSFTVAKDIAIENYIAYQTAKKTNNVKAIGKLSNKKVENSFEYVGELFFSNRKREYDNEVEADCIKSFQKNPTWTQQQKDDYKNKLIEEKQNQIKNQRHLFVKMCSVFGKKDIKDITKQDVIFFVDSLKNHKTGYKLSDSSQNKYRTIAKQIFKFALENKDDKDQYFITSLPDIPTTRNTTQNYNPPFTQDEMNRILDNMRTRFYDVSVEDFEKIKKNKTKYKVLKDNFLEKFKNHQLKTNQEIWYEVYDAVLFIYGTFLRAGNEFTEMRFKDVSIDDLIIDGRRQKVLRLRPITSKVRSYDYDTYSMSFAVNIFKNCMIRNEKYKPDDFIFFNSDYPTFKRRKTFGKWLSDKFREVLEATDTRLCKRTGQNRSLRCLRNTALTRRRESSNASEEDISSNARTSPDMLRRFYNRQVDRKKIGAKVLGFNKK